MESHSPTSELSSVNDVCRVLTELVWPDTQSEDRIGIETEVFPILTDDGRPLRRLPLKGPGGVRHLTEDALGPHPETPYIPTAGGGRITFEPGGQIEHSSAPHSDVDSVFAEIDPIWDALEAQFAEHQARLVPLGLDPWHCVEDVPQQLEAGRYRVMERYWDARWPEGAVMMRNTCSLQVNLDAGSGEVRSQRWEVANLMAPFLSAMFSTSPTTKVGGGRAKVWQSMDPTRTGLPKWKNGSGPDPMSDCIRRVLDADVMYVTRDGTAIQVGPGVPFSEWLARPIPEVGRPTREDLSTHLSTIFTEVRPRKGTLEFRSIDALPRRWWAVPVVLVTALIYEETARSKALDILRAEPESPRVLLTEAADLGMRSERISATAATLAGLALDAASGADRYSRAALLSLENYLDTYTFKGLAPADEIRPLLDQPAALLDWATRPTP